MAMQLTAQDGRTDMAVSPAVLGVEDLTQRAARLETKLQRYGQLIDTLLQEKNFDRNIRSLLPDARDFVVEEGHATQAQVDLVIDAKWWERWWRIVYRKPILSILFVVGGVMTALAATEWLPQGLKFVLGLLGILIVTVSFHFLCL